jgi:hypothetical protein
VRVAFALLLITARAAFADVGCPAALRARSSFVLLDQGSLAVVDQAARQASKRGSVKISAIWKQARCSRMTLAGYTVRIALDRRDAGRYELVGVAGQGIWAHSVTRDPEDAWIEVQVAAPGATERAIGAIWRGDRATHVVAAMLPPGLSIRISDDQAQCIDDWGELRQPMMSPLVDGGPVRLAMHSEPRSTIVESALDESAAGIVDGAAELTVDGAPLTPSSISPRRASFVIDPRCPDGRLVPRTITLRATWRTRYRFAASKQQNTHTATVDLGISANGLLYRP